MTRDELQSIKNKFDIVGTDPSLNRALEICVGVAPTDLTVLITGESGVGKDVLPKIIHQHSRRRTGKYFAVNCGAIPEGTIDSELFGHEKGAFTGAVEMRRGYFEEADGGTLFLDEIAELPLSSQAKLLRVLQSGEFMRVGSAKVMKTDVRVVVATNMNLEYAVSKGRFRKDLLYRIAAVTVTMPSLRERKEDIHLLFRKFSSDFSEKYRVPRIALSDDAVAFLRSYRWPGNIRQLKNVAEAVSALESAKFSSREERVVVNAAALAAYLPKEDADSMLPVIDQNRGDAFTSTEREQLIGIIVQLKRDVDHIKKVLGMQDGQSFRAEPPRALPQPYDDWQTPEPPAPKDSPKDNDASWEAAEFTGVVSTNDGEDSLNIHDREKNAIREALRKHGGNRKKAAEELGMSERSLYRKLKTV